MNEQLLIELAERGETQRSIGEILGKSQSNVKYFLKKYGIKTRYTDREILPDDTRRCVYCKQLKLQELFYKRSDSGRPTAGCRDCTVSRWLEKRKKFKLACVEYKGGACKFCNYSRCVTALEFHHRDPNGKDFSVSDSTKRKLADVVEELDKCDLLCANCHREEHERLYGIVAQR